MAACAGSVGLNGEGSRLFMALTPTAQGVPDLYTARPGCFPNERRARISIRTTFVRHQRATCGGCVACLVSAAFLPIKFVILQQVCRSPAASSLTCTRVA